MSTPRINRNDKNYIINGSLAFWQRGTSFSVNTATTTQSYTADRMQHTSSGPTVKNYTISRSSSVPSVDGLVYSKRFVCNTAIPSFATNDNIDPFGYPVEGTFAKTLNNKTTTFGFFVFSSQAGTLPVSFRTYASGARSYVTTVTIAAGEINSWVFKKVTVQQESGNIAKDNSIGLLINIGVFTTVAANVTSSLNVWQSGNFVAPPSGSINPMAVSGAVLAIAGMMLLEGDVDLTGTQFIQAGGNDSAELALCQRYYEKSYDLDVVPGTVDGSGIILTTYGNGTGVHFVSQYFKTIKRVPPLCTTYSGTTGTINNINILSSSFNGNASSGNNPSTAFVLINSYNYNINAIARSHFHFSADAEL